MSEPCVNLFRRMNSRRRLCPCSPLAAVAMRLMVAAVAVENSALESRRRDLARARMSSATGIDRGAIGHAVFLHVGTDEEFLSFGGNSLFNGVNQGPAP